MAESPRVAYRSERACIHGLAVCGQCPETTLPPVPAKPSTITALRTAGDKVRTWTEKRDELICQAVEEGGSLREVGDAAGLSHTAVKFIAHGRD